MNLKSWKEISPGGIITNSGNSKENKTGSWRVKKPRIDLEKCIKCKQCLPLCPENSIYVDEKDAISIDLDHCKGCGICAQICPKKAIEEINE